MAKRLIDANSFVIEELLDRDKTEYLDTFVDGVRATMKAIRTAPTVPAAEVIRCRNCIHDSLSTCPMCYIEGKTLVFVNHDPDFYCGNGERRCEE